MSRSHDPTIYPKLLEMNSPDEDYNITKDILRTFPERKEFKEPIESGENA